jgi:hypothetical protein
MSVRNGDGLPERKKKYFIYHCLQLMNVGGA